MGEALSLLDANPQSTRMRGFSLASAWYRLVVPLTLDFPRQLHPFLLTSDMRKNDRACLTCLLTQEP